MIINHSDHLFKDLLILTGEVAKTLMVLVLNELINTLICFVRFLALLWSEMFV